MKTIAEILNSFKNNLKSLNSPLASFTNYSNIYLLARSFAQIVSSQYSDLESYYLNSFLSNAIGDNLDNRARDYNLTRAIGTPSVGYIYTTATVDTILPAGTILNTSTSSFQFQTTEESIITPTGVYIPIAALSNTEVTNLNAGTTLTSTFYPLLSFIIANSKDLNGNYIGGLGGGKSPESDADFRSRILIQLNNLTRGTLDSITSRLNELSVPKFFIKEGFPVTGYFTVYINTQSQELLDLIEKELIQVKPAGVAFEVRPITSYYIDIKFTVSLISLEFAENVSNAITQICTNYFNTLELGQELYPINLAVLCSNISGVKDIRVTDPSESKVTAPKDTLLKLRNIDLTIKG